MGAPFMSLDPNTQNFQGAHPNWLMNPVPLPPSHQHLARTGLQAQVFNSLPFNTNNLTEKLSHPSTSNQLSSLGSGFLMNEDEAYNQFIGVEQQSLTSKKPKAS